MVRIDTNYIVRYFINDNKIMADEAEQVLLSNKVFIANEIIAEVIYVLDGVYNISRDKIANLLLELINFQNILVTNKKILKESLEIYKVKNLDFVDCLLCAYSKKDEMLTFDKKLNKCIKNAKA